MDYVYKPYSEREPREDYKNILREVLDSGEWRESRMVDKNGNPLKTKSKIGVMSRFNILENGAPIITERDISGFYKSAIGEIFAFVNGACTQEELVEYGCRWWKNWATPEKCAKRGLEAGNLGPGSYGAAFQAFPCPDGTTFDQFAEIVKQMQEHPELKTHVISPWIPEYTIRNSNHQQKVVVVPCHGWIHFHIFDDKLSMTMWQRSCDLGVGLPSNWAQYSALLLAMADCLNLQPGEFVHQISDAHIYNDQMPFVEEILSRETHAYPTLKLVRHKDDIKKYRREDFELSDYHSGDKIKNIPAGI